MRRTPFSDPVDSHHARRFGIWLFLVSLAMLFAAVIVAIVVLRVQLSDVWPDDLPFLPAGLVVSTTLLGASTITMHRAVALEYASRSARTMLAWTTILGGLFLVAQAWSWFAWFGAVSDRWQDSDPWRVALSGFYVLTGLHAAHVVGGLIALALTLLGARGLGARYAAMYWDFLGVAWLVLLVVLLLVR